MRDGRSLGGSLGSEMHFDRGFPHTTFLSTNVVLPQPAKTFLQPFSATSSVWRSLIRQIQQPEREIPWVRVAIANWPVTHLHHLL
ncbi:unnamed protein product [Victoria cruziana]